MNNFGTQAGRYLGGIKAGAENVRANRAAKLGIFAPGVQRVAAMLMLHKRWHIDRNKPNLSCYLCRGTKTKV